MKRPGSALLSATLVSVLVAGAAGMALVGTQRAEACSIAAITARELNAWVVPNSHIVALGTFIASRERVAHFRVDRSLKGSAPGEVLTVDNRGTQAGLSCSPYDEPFKSGHRFPGGKRSILVLEKEVDGLWQIAWASRAAFEVPGTNSEGMTMDWGTFQYSGQSGDAPPTLRDLEAAAGQPTGVPAREPVVASAPVERVGGKAVVLVAAAAALTLVTGSMKLIQRRRRA